MILLVEDDPVTAKLMTRALEQIGAEVTVCRDGREALHAFATATTMSSIAASRVSIVSPESGDNAGTDHPFLFLVTRRCSERALKR
jgi:CheY-like chemotaxis protein